MAGFSDHTMGTTASVAAIALGACLIEKHFTFRCVVKDPTANSRINRNSAKLQVSRDRSYE